MDTTRQRRAGTNPPAAAPTQAVERVYTEDDYAAPEDAEALSGEWASDAPLYAAGWTGESLLPDEAFQPDQEDIPEADWTSEDDAYAPADEYMPLFNDDMDFDDDLDPLDDDLLTEEEQAELRRSHWQLLAGLADFAGVIAGTAAILILVTLLVSLLNWLVGDLSQSFILLQKNF